MVIFLGTSMYELGEAQSSLLQPIPKETVRQEQERNEEYGK